jgi:hypothetical protein
MSNDTCSPASWLIVYTVKASSAARLKRGHRDHVPMGGKVSISDTLRGR